MIIFRLFDNLSPSNVTIYSGSPSPRQGTKHKIVGKPKFCSKYRSVDSRDSIIENAIVLLQVSPQFDFSDECTTKAIKIGIVDSNKQLEFCGFGKYIFISTS